MIIKKPTVIHIYSSLKEKGEDKIHICGNGDIHSMNGIIRSHWSLDDKALISKVCYIVVNDSIYSRYRFCLN